MINLKLILLVCILFATCYLETEGSSANESIAIIKGQTKISDHVRAILEHYKQKDPVGLPGAPVPDPQNIPPLTHSFSIGRMAMSNIKLYGLSKFRIDHITANLAAMEAEVAVKFDNLEVYGNYTLNTGFFSRSAGPFTVKLKDVFGKATARLDVEINGQLEAQDISMDISFQKIDMNFERLGLFASVFQDMINSVGTFVFDSIKPFMLKEINANIRTDVNKQVKKIPQHFPNSISPLDQLIAEARRQVRNSGCDPYKVNDYNHTAGLITLQMTHTWLTGLSSFHRVGNITFEMKNNSVFGTLQVGTQKLQGSSNWEVSVIGGVLSTAGTVVFTVDYIKVELAVMQSLDTREPPVLEDIQLELGNIQVRFDGAGTIDYIIELAVNVIPNVLRYQIMDALESPLKVQIQEHLNRVNVEKVILENVDELAEGKRDGNNSQLNKLSDIGEMRTRNEARRFYAGKMLLHTVVLSVFLNLLSCSYMEIL